MELSIFHKASEGFPRFEVNKQLSVEGSVFPLGDVEHFQGECDAFPHILYILLLWDSADSSVLAIHGV